jgi:hypothetical protein
MEAQMADMPMRERQQAAKQGQAMPGGRFPIKNRGDLENAIRAVGRAGGPNGTEDDRRKVRSFIIKRAKALGLANLIPDTWSADGSLKS